MDIQIAARPNPVTCATERSAVIVVDMQHDFASPGGMFHRAGIDIAPIQAIVAPTAAVLDAARAAGVLVVYLRMGFGADLADAGAPAAPNWLKHLPLGVGDEIHAPDGSTGRILVRETWNTRIVDELAPHDGDLVVDKHRFSGFFETDLDARLRSAGVDTLLLTGATTSVCVESTLRDAMFRDYHCLLVEDCVAEPIGDGLPRSNHEASCLVVEVLFGSITDAAAVVSALT